ncbi:MAG: maleylpyruvate isomerase family mycothiol-dependent enzyme [Actinobacteria bacterium]|nr:maleylpyruvate isomerase family mycothiol-dependent enzyme [Actinomycetota bacterium]
MDDVVEAFEEEGAALDVFLSSLDGEQWQHPSSCEGWSVADVVLHLAQTEESVVATFEEGGAGRPFAKHVAEAASAIGGTVDALADAAVVAERPDDPLEALERWRVAHRRGLEGFKNAGPSDRLNWIAVPLSARTLVTTRLSEHWIHSMDIREPLGDPVPDTDRLRFIARLAWRTLPYAFGRVGEDAPSVALRLAGPNGDVWSFGDDDAEVTITGPAGDWCRLAARRMTPPESTSVTAGDRADRVLELVRTYA